MKKTAKVLADYIIKKGMAGETNREMYEYGFIITLELGMFALFSIVISLYLHMVVEGILFFAIFVPLRSYAGGLHLNKFYSCFVLSCLTFWGILLIIRNIHIPIIAALIILMILETCIFILYPVENVNRAVDSEEDRYFRKRLRRFLIIHLVIAIVCVILKWNRFLTLIAATYAMVVITMAIGKYKNTNNNAN